MYSPYLNPDSNKLKIDTVMRQLGQFEQWPVHLMILKNCYFFRGGGFVVMLKKSPYILELYTKVITNEIL